MRLLLISLIAMTVSTICLSAIFLRAVYAPTRPIIGAWTTTVTSTNDDWVKRTN